MKSYKQIKKADLLSMILAVAGAFVFSIGIMSLGFEFGLILCGAALVLAAKYISEGAK